jgi:hypothetical protein
MHRLTLREPPARIHSARLPRSIALPSDDYGHPSSEAAQLLSLQQRAGNLAVSRLIAGSPSSMPVIQRKQAQQTFKDVLRDLVGTLGPTSRIGKILDENARKNVLPSKDAELGLLFRAAWKGDETAESDSDDDRAMMEGLLQTNTYGIGAAARDARLASDVGTHFGKAPDQADPNIINAFRNALFFRGERKDSSGQARGFLEFDPTKHGKAGSARDMPGRRGEGVRSRADQYLFVTKEGKEAKDYIDKAQGGARELLTIVASRDEVQAMVYDVDSRGYKTKEPLTGILQGNVITEKARDNLNSWLRVKQTDDSKLNPILQSLLP